MSDPILPTGVVASGFVPQAAPLPSGFPGAKPAPGDPGGVALSSQAAPAPAVNPLVAAHTSRQVVEAAITQIREYLKNLPPEIQFSEDRSSGHIVFKVVNPVTHEVIRQYPPEEILTMARRLKSLQEGKSGVLVDEQF